MQRRTFLQGMLALPLVGLTAKAVAKDNDGLYPWQRDTLKKISENNETLSVPTKKRDISHVLFFRREMIQGNMWEDMSPIMVLRDKEQIPSKVLFLCEAAVDITNQRVVKSREFCVADLTEQQHKDFCLTAITRAYFNFGDGPHELTDEIRVKNGLAFANLRDSKTGEML